MGNSSGIVGWQLAKRLSTAEFGRQGLAVVYPYLLYVVGFFGVYGQLESWPYTEKSDHHLGMEE